MLKILDKILKPTIDVKKTEETSLHPMLLLGGVVLFCAALTYIIPAGNYGRYLDGNGQTLIEQARFYYVERTPCTFMGFLESFTKGLQNCADIVFFLMIIGGMFAIINGTGALNVGMANALHRIEGKEIFMIPAMMALFGCGSAFCGNFEEFLVFVPLILACSLTMGFDSLTAIAIIFVAATAGYAGALTNAFTVGRAQEIAGLKLFSGMSFRWIVFMAMEFVSILYVCIYAKLIKKNPKMSGAFAFDQKYNQEKKINLNSIPKLTTRQAFVILIFVLGILFAVWGIIRKGFYIDELSGVFLLTGILAGIVGGLNAKRICECIEKGFRDMVLPCIMIGLANTAVIIMQDANIMDTILRYLAGILGSFPNSLIAWGMFFVQDLINIFVPSGSAQAALTMPLMVPIADGTGITRQTAVLAYQLGDAFTNIVSPTGGEILAALAICKVPFGKWLKFLLPLFVIWVVMALIFLTIATNIGYL